MYLKPSWAALAWPLLLLALGAPGCGPSGPRVVEVTGTVTRKGQPVEKLTVNFMPEHGRPSWGITDKDGQYKLNYSRGRDGAMVATHKVFVQLRPTSAKEEVEMSQGLVKLHPEMQAILKKYGKLETTPLTVEVKDNNQVVNLQLD